MSERKPFDTNGAPSRPELPLWRRDGFFADDWLALADAEALPASGSVIVPLPRWLAERHTLLKAAGRSRCFGVRIGVDDAIDRLGEAIGGLGLIVLHFPKFTDGRAYSTARRLRQQVGYAGELRASGDVLFDQLPLMLACGFDSFEITDAATRRLLERHAAQASDSYQIRLQGGRDGSLQDRRQGAMLFSARGQEPERMCRPNPGITTASTLTASR